jgi:hypothetical protein
MLPHHPKSCAHAAINEACDLIDLGTRLALFGDVLLVLSLSLRFLLELCSLKGAQSIVKIYYFSLLDFYLLIYHQFFFVKRQIHHSFIGSRAAS